MAATMLTIYLFNIGGQLTLHQYFSYLSDRFFNEQASKGLYNVNDVTEITIPLNMPGITDWKNYENVSGQIQFENVSYNYVKMRMTRTAMYLVCVPNYKTTRLLNQNIIGAKKIKDIQLPKKNHVPYGKVAVLGQFSLAFTHFEFNTPFKNITIKVIHTAQQIFDHSPSIPEQPPRPVC